MPYLYIAYFSTNSKNERNIKKLVIFSLPSILVFFIVFIFGKSNAEDVKNIFLSLNNIGYSISGGAINFLNKDIFYGLHMVQESFLNDKYYFYGLITLISFFAFIPIKNKITLIFNHKLFLILIISSIAMSLSLFLLAVDWGRWIYIHLFSMFLITLLISDSHNIDDKYILLKNILSKTKILIITVVFYSLTWYIPHCGSPSTFIPRDLKQQPVLAYFKPFVKIACFINPSLKSLLKKKLR